MNELKNDDENLKKKLEFSLQAKQTKDRHAEIHGRRSHTPVITPPMPASTICTFIF